MKRSILIVCDRNGRTSIGHMALSMRSALLASGWDAETLWLRSPKFFPSDEGLPGPALDAAFHQTGFFAYRAGFRRILEERRPDAVLLAQPCLGHLVREVRKALPEARAGVFVHDVFAQTLYPRSPKFALFNRLFVRGTEKADFYLYNSEWTRAQAEAFFGIGDRPHATVGCPIPPAFADPVGPMTEGERRNFRERRGMEGFNGLCLTVSLDEERKNLATFAETAALRPRIAFVRIGRPSPKLDARARELGLRNLFGFHGLSDAELRDFYRAADLFVCPSWLEGFGMTPLEALSCGTRAAVARTSALAEIFSEALPTVSPANDATSWASVLDDAVAGLPVVRPEGVSALLARFSPAAFGERLDAAFRRFLS